ncbi:hypothetical protein GQ457_09G019500 [Hibiscus cannabinus]
MALKFTNGSLMVYAKKIEIIQLIFGLKLPMNSCEIGRIFSDLSIVDGALAEGAIAGNACWDIIRKK